MSFLLNPFIFGAGAGGTPTPTPPDTGEHRYWRFFGLAGSGSNVQYSEIEFQDELGTELSVGGIPNASSEFSGSFIIENAFDGSTTTNWAAVGNAGQWASYDFGTEVNIDKASFILSSVASSERWTWIALEYSDDNVNWTRKGISEPSLTYNARPTPTIIEFPNNFDEIPPTIPYRYWRIYLITASGSPFNGLESLDMYGTTGGSGDTDLTTTEGGTASASNSQGSFPPSQAFDDNTGTSWFTNAVGTPAWLQWDFGAGNEQLVQSFRFKVSTTSGSDWVEFAFQYSSDGTNWTTAHFATGQLISEGLSYSADIV